VAFWHLQSALHSFSAGALPYNAPPDTLRKIRSFSADSKILCGSHFANSLATSPLVTLPQIPSREGETPSPLHTPSMPSASRHSRIRRLRRLCPPPHFQKSGYATGPISAAIFSAHAGRPCLVSSEGRTCFETECVMALQGHPRSLILAPNESAYASFYWYSIVILVLSCPVSEILQVSWEERPHHSSTQF